MWIEHYEKYTWRDGRVQEIVLFMDDNFHLETWSRFSDDEPWTTHEVNKLLTTEEVADIMEDYYKKLEDKINV